MMGLPSYPHPPSQYITSRTQLPSAALGSPPQLGKQKILPGLWEQNPLPPPQ